MFNFIRRKFRRTRPPTLTDIADLIDSTVNGLYQNQSYTVLANYEQNAVDVYDFENVRPGVRLFYTEIMSHRHSAHEFFVYLKSKIKEKTMTSMYEHKVDRIDILNTVARDIWPGEDPFLPIEFGGDTGKPDRIIGYFDTCKQIVIEPEEFYSDTPLALVKLKLRQAITELIEGLQTIKEKL